MSQAADESGARPAWRQRARAALLVAPAGVLPLLVGGVVHRQGIDLLDDGLWLLGARVLADGGWLHRDLYVADGPARYAALLPWWAALGRSALALAWLKAVSDGLAGALGFWVARRAGARGFAWLVPLGVIALGPFPPGVLAAAFVTVAWALALERAAGARRAPACGLAIGLLGAFGCGPFALGAAGTLLTAALHSVARGRPRRREAVATAARLAAGAVVGLAAVAALHGRSGTLGLAWTDEVAQPVSRWWLQATHGGAADWLGSFRGGPWLSLPFAEVATGERLGAAWPAHAHLRAFSFRLLYLGSWLVPLAGVAAIVRRRRGGLAAGAVAWALCSWGVLLTSGDLPHLRASWSGPLLLSAVVLGWTFPRVPRAGGRDPRAWPARIALVLLACALLPPLAERGWLVGNAKRPSLVTWARPRARIALAAARCRGLEDTFLTLVAGARAAPAAPSHDDPAAGVLIWPHQPGLYFLMDLPLPTAQVTLAPEEVRDPARVTSQLERSRPAHALLGLTPSISGTYLRRAAPELWAYLRQHYTVATNLAEQPDPFRVLARAPGGLPQILTLPLTQRLPDLEQAVANDAGPAMRPDFTVGQTFPVGSLDLAGFSVRWRTRGTDVRLRLRVGIWVENAGAFDTLLDFFDVDVSVAGDLDRSWLRFAPVGGTAGHTVALTLELLAAVPDEVRLMWHRHDSRAAGTDLFPEGTALVDMAPVAADLWFCSY